MDADTTTDSPTTASTDVATREPQPTAPAVNITFTDEQIQIIQETICRPRHRPASPGELGLFLARCQRTGLDPLAGQIHAVFRNDRRAGGERMTIQVGIDGFRLVAQRTGEFAGVTTEWCGPDGVWRDVWLEQARPAAARATAYRIVQGRVVGQTAVATWAEYGDTKNVWQHKPAHMLAKCAQALALRSMFPAELSGLYTSDEMRDADPRDDTAPPVPPWALTASQDALRQAVVNALDVAGVPRNEHAQLGRAVLLRVKEFTGGALPASIPMAMQALADAVSDYLAAAEHDATVQATAAAERDPDPVEVVDGVPVDDGPTLPGFEPTTPNEPRPHYEEN